MRLADCRRIFPDIDALNAAAAARWVGIAQAAIEARGICHVVLAGGSTPRALYEMLAGPTWRGHIDWSRTQIWFGDERPVPPEHPDSNYRMAREAMLAQLAVPPDNIHRIEAERDPVSAARDYAARIAELLHPPHGYPPRFDLVLLGLGPDGHIASLFPGTPLLDEKSAWVGACEVSQLGVWRISMTLPVLDAARHLLLLTAGEGKAAIVHELVSGDVTGRVRYPVELLRPAGEFEWLLDRAAAGSAADC